MRIEISALLLLSLAACEGYQPTNRQSNTVEEPSALSTNASKTLDEPIAGMSKEYAIEVCGTSGEREYLDSLDCDDGKEPTYRRAGNVGPRNSITQLSIEEGFAQQSQDYVIPDGVEDQHVIDEYVVTCGQSSFKVYLDMYHCVTDNPDSDISGFPLNREKLENYAEKNPTSCKVNDPDIGSAYYGGCENGLAQGIGVAIGRDEFRGEFEQGEVNGYGMYIWGSDSDWASERHMGSFQQGKKHGYGVTTVDVDSSHIHLAWYKENALHEGDKLVLRGIFLEHEFALACESPHACQEEIERLRSNSME